MNKTTQPVPHRSFGRFMLGILYILALLATGYHGLQLTEQNQRHQQTQHHNQQQEQLSAQIAQQAEQAMQGNTDAFAALRQAREAYGAGINQASEPSTTGPEASQWLTLRTEIEQILLAQAALQTHQADQTQINTLLEQLDPLVIQFAQQLADINSPHTVPAIQSINAIHQIDPTDSTALKEQHSVLSNRYATFVAGTNNKPRITAPQARQTLDQITTLLATLGAQLDNLTADQPIRLRAEQAYQALTQTLATLNKTSIPQSVNTYFIQIPGYTPQQILYGLIGITLILIVLWIISSSRNGRRQARYAQQQYHLNKQYQTGLHKLASGDLSETQAAPEILSEVAQQIQRMVRKIQQTHLKITNCGHETQDSSLRLQETAEHQQDQTEHAISQNQRLTEQLAQLSTDTAQAGTESQAVQHSLAQITTIEHHTDFAQLQHNQQTATEHLQHAVTTTQQVQDQMRLIEELADQSNILALNAAMQAALAGEAGRTFTVISNEVQRLAQQANNSTRQIGGLLENIQHNHQTSLEQLQQTASELEQKTTTATELAHQIAQLHTASQQHTEQLTQLAQNTEQHTKEASLLNDNLHIMHNIGQQTQESSVQIAEAIRALSAQAEPLQTVIQQYQATPTGQTPTLSAH